MIELRGYSLIGGSHIKVASGSSNITPSKASSCFRAFDPERHAASGVVYHSATADEVLAAALQAEAAATRLAAWRPR